MANGPIKADFSGQPGDRAARAVAQICTGIGIYAFWLLFFTVGASHSKPPPCFFEFEHSFPLPDSILAAGLIASGIALLRGLAWGPAISLVCAGGLLFLGVIDLAFTAKSGGFSGPLPEAIQSAAISIWCIALGLWIMSRDCPRPMQQISQTE